MPASHVAHVWERGPDEPSARYVLLALADEAGGHGVASPLPLERLSDKTGLSTGALEATLEYLQENGWIEARDGTYTLLFGEDEEESGGLSDGPALRGLGEERASRDESSSEGSVEKLRKIARGDTPADKVKTWHDTPTHWAVLMYEKYTGHRPGAWPRDRIKHSVDDPSRWAQALCHALDQGWQPTSVGHVLDYYENETESAYKTESTSRNLERRMAN